MIKKRVMRPRPAYRRGQRQKPCFFCQEKQEPDYKSAEVLRRATSERGKIIGRGRGGFCRKHQKKLSLAVKRARILGLLPFVVKVR